MKSLKQKLLKLLRTRFTRAKQTVDQGREILYTPMSSIAQLNPESMYEFKSFSFWQSDAETDEN
jgi:hypothetical protein